MTTSSPQRDQLQEAAEELRAKLLERLSNECYLKVSVGEILWVNEGRDPRFNVVVETPVGLITAEVTFTESPDYQKYPLGAGPPCFKVGRLWGSHSSTSSRLWPRGARRKGGPSPISS